MEIFFKGIFLGLSLAILVGPIVFALIQTAIERGFRAGAVVGSGIWCSDLLFIFASWFGISYITAATEWSGFEQTLGTAGGLLLIGFGFGTIFGKPPTLPLQEDRAEDIIDNQLPAILDFDDDDGINRPGYLSLWLKGFLINTINPFTVFFWSGVAGTMIAGENLSTGNAVIFFGAILLTLVLTDLAKVWAAKSIRHLLKPKAILNLRRVSGAALVIFGLVLLIRVYN